MHSQMTPRHEQFLERSLPQSEEAERCIIGGILVDETLFTQAAERLTPDSFYSPRHRHVFAAMMSLFDAKKMIDPINVGEELKKDALLDSCGGVAMITNLSYGLPFFRDLSSYIEIVSEKKKLRELIASCNQIISSALSEEEDAPRILANAQTEINEVCNFEDAKSFTPASVLAFESVQKTEKLRNGEIEAKGLKTGFRGWDFITGGLRDTDLIIIAGRPGMGKSALVANVIQNACTEHRGAVIPVFSLEMSKEQYIDRMVASRAGVDYTKMKNGHCSEMEMIDVRRAGSELQAMNFMIDDSSTINAMQMRSKIMKTRHEKGRLDAIVVDFLQRMTASKKTDGRTQEVSAIARELKSLAKDLKVPVIALSSLSRECEKRSPPIPRMSDLRESGDIESEADMVAFIYRESYYNKNANPTEAQMIVDKNRHGPLTTVDLKFMGEYVRFSDGER